jgi:hypothetical protein
MKTIEIECWQNVKRQVQVDVTDEQYELLMNLDDFDVHAVRNKKEYGLLESLVRAEDPYDWEDEYTGVEITDITNS